MAKMIKEKSLRCIEWRLEPLPMRNSGVTTSKAFTLQERKCFFEFYPESFAINDYDVRPRPIPIRLKFKIEGALPLPVATTLRVLSGFETLHYEEFILSTTHDIWKPASVNSSCLTFQVIFHEDIWKEDKCIQTASYMNASSSLSDDFSKLLETGLDHDLVMKCCGESIKVHRIVLNSRSDVFKAMLQNDMVESQTGVIEIEDIGVNYIQDFVKYLYTDAMPELNFDKAKVVYEAGDKYAIKSLMFRCAEYLKDNLSPENAFECYALADAHSDQSLMDRIKTYILEKQVYLEEEYWLPFHETFPKIALEVYRLSYKKGD